MSKLPRAILEKAVKLRDPLKHVFIALYSYGPASATELAGLLNHNRAYVSMRLNQLADMGLIKRTRLRDRTVVFEVIK